MRRSLLSLCLPLVVCACGPAAVSGPASRLPSEPTQFPTQDTLIRIAAAPVPARLFEDERKDVPTWDLSEPLAEAMELVPHHDDSPWSQLLDVAVASRGDAVTTSEAMHCVAREHAAFVLANGAAPAEPLVHFIAARCGSPTGLIGVAFQTITGDERTPDAQVEAQLREPARAMITRTIQAGRLDAGVAYARKSGHAVLALAVAPRALRVDRMPIVPAPDGTFTVRGEVLDPVGSARMMINRGRYGVGACAPDLSIALPRFAFTCAALPGDEAAWIAMSVVPPGRILGTAALDMLVWPAGAPRKTYAKLTRDTAAVSPGVDVKIPGLLAEINRVRQEAGLGALSLAEQQSQTVARLVPHYFAALHERESSPVADQIALGLRAGWEVPGLVRHGNVVSTWVRGSTDYTEVVRVALAHPFGRETLLDPYAERLALGTVGAERDPDLGAIFATYALFDSYRHDGDVSTVAIRLTALRAARHAMAPTMVTELNVESQRAAKSVQDGLRTPEEAMDDLAKRAAERVGGRSVHAGVSESSAIEDVKFPDAMLTTPVLWYGAGVGHYRRQGHPWGRFLVFYVMVDAPAGPTARQGGAHAG